MAHKMQISEFLVDQYKKLLYLKKQNVLKHGFHIYKIW